MEVRNAEGYSQRLGAPLTFWPSSRLMDPCTEYTVGTGRQKSDRDDPDCHDADR